MVIAIQPNSYITDLAGSGLTMDVFSLNKLYVKAIKWGGLDNHWVQPLKLDIQQHILCSANTISVEKSHLMKILKRQVSY